jgi:protein phosphatase
VQRGDCYLLCTDGLADVADAEMQRNVLTGTPQRACDMLVGAANDRGGYDNVTVMVIRVD